MIGRARLPGIHKGNLGTASGFEAEFTRTMLALVYMAASVKGLAAHRARLVTQVTQFEAQFEALLLAAGRTILANDANPGGKGISHGR